ncbi:MAG: hypothetical protein J6C29_03460 [Clostridia bacterium]|nr:hypothetical protein [Clostridia bacterium]
MIKHNINIYKKDKENNRLKIISIVVFIVIYLTDTLLFATSTITLLNLARRFIPVIIAAFMFFVIKSADSALILVILSMFSSMVLYRENLYFYISAIALLYCAYACSKYISLEEFEEAYIKWMRIIAIISLVCFVLGGVIKSIGIIPTVTNTADNTYKTLFFTNIPVSNSLSRRNLGPFWEPGVYQYYLNIALIFVFHKEDKKMKYDVVLFIVTLLTTMSGAAILPLPFIFLAYVLNSKDRKNVKPYIYVIVFLFLGILLLQTGMFDEIINKILGKNDDGLSRGFRIGSAVANIKMAIQYPLFGADPTLQGELRAETIQALNGYATEGNTNTLLGYASYFGIFVAGYLWKRLYGFCRQISATTFSTVCLFIAIFLMTSNENLILSALLYVLMFLKTEISLSQKKREWKIGI